MDDDKFVRDTLTMMLSKATYTVTVVESGSLALQLLRNNTQHNVDLVLADVCMPVMDGFQLLQEIRVMDSLNSVPVVMMSGIEGREEISRCLAHGADSYLIKPLRMQEVKLLWQHVMNKKKEVLARQFLLEQLASQYVEPFSSTFFLLLPCLWFVLSFSLLSFSVLFCFLIFFLFHRCWLLFVSLPLIFPLFASLSSFFVSFPFVSCILSVHQPSFTSPFDEHLPFILSLLFCFCFCSVLPVLPFFFSSCVSSTLVDMRRFLGTTMVQMSKKHQHMTRALHKHIIKTETLEQELQQLKQTAATTAQASAMPVAPSSSSSSAPHPHALYHSAAPSGSGSRTLPAAAPAASRQVCLPFFG